jgi:hypothetical protein
MLTLPAAPPPDESVLAVRLEAWQSGVPPAAGVDGAGELLLGVDVPLGAADEELLEGDAAGVVGCDCGWLGPQAVKRRAAPAAVMTADTMLIL